MKKPAIKKTVNTDLFKIDQSFKINDLVYFLDFNRVSPALVQCKIIDIRPQYKEVTNCLNFYVVHYMNDNNILCSNLKLQNEIFLNPDLLKASLQIIEFNEN